MMTRTLSAAPQLPFKKLLACNRGEIAVRIMRAASELGIRTCGIFSHEDRLTAHRYKADESFLVGEGLSPVGAYLHVEEIVDLMLRQARSRTFIAERPRTEHGMPPPHATELSLTAA